MHTSPKNEFFFISQRMKILRYIAYSAIKKCSYMVQKRHYHATI